MEEKVVVAVQGLVKAYNGQRAVDSIKFQVEKGEVLGIIGPNGAGKTTIPPVREHEDKGLSQVLCRYP